MHRVYRATHSSTYGDRCGTRTHSLSLRISNSYSTRPTSSRLRAPPIATRAPTSSRLRALTAARPRPHDYSSHDIAIELSQCKQQGSLDTVTRLDTATELDTVTALTGQLSTARQDRIIATQDRTTTTQNCCKSMVSI